ncbi:RNA polymerase sigma-70 factor (ECF subfamily) [Paenibacillus sp. BK033]|uniref:RNA polymerase sigma factor n=1 Tax=Paenibacillus sp. BK033 TaxID=2512133 RepID=UPI0010526B4E|nr:RNA polymerase sigma factor [Paenibacillus sp. BK033]TCM96948.1 RNA polymerase sigma-70 factor (ECF subfamily) [Paenibacillus sp. BK033]
MSDFATTVAEETRAAHKKFEELVLPHRQSLWRYCRYLTGSPWEGEDLFQETMLKAFATMTQIWNPIAYQSYLFRIATNARIDSLRKRQVQIDQYAGPDAIESASAVDPLETIEAVETLLQHLPPRQIAVFLLMEAFGFSAADVAGMVRITEGLVYSALHRARVAIRQLRNGTPKPKWTEKDEQANPLLMELLQALREGEAVPLLQMLGDSVHNDAQPGFQEYSKREMLEGSLRHRGPALHVSLEWLWGRRVFIIQAETPQGLELHDIHEYEFDKDQIVYHRGYYFCKELLSAASKELGIPLQLQKDPHIDWR